MLATTNAAWLDLGCFFSVQNFLHRVFVSLGDRFGTPSADVRFEHEHSLNNFLCKKYCQKIIYFQIISAGYNYNNCFKFPKYLQSGNDR